MGRVVRFASPRQASLVELPDVELEPDKVRVRTLYSGISAGTELTAYRGTNPSLTATWDDERRLFVPGGASSMTYPVDGWGYEEVGTVVEVGASTSGVDVGDTIWGTWGHREIVALDGAYASARLLPADTDPLIGIFSEIGAIALNVVLDADIHVGETVAVFGLGVPGQLVCQLARLNGARVLAVDFDERRRELAGRLGAAEVIDASRGQVAEQIRALTDGRGADSCLEVSGNYSALHEAIRAVAYSSRVVVAGFFQGEAIGLRLGEEAHHNRVQVVVSQIFGVAPALQHRWNEERLQSAFMTLAADNRLQLTELITHVMPAADAQQAFDLLDRSPGEALQVVLEF